MDRQLHAFNDPTRRAILRQLADGERSAGEIAERFAVTRPAISHHLRVLKGAGLIVVRRQAQSRLYSIDPAAVEALRVGFNRFWQEALPRLKAVVESDRRRSKETAT